MSNTVIRLKKSSLPGDVPSSLEHGELAINYADGKLYYKDPSNTIQQISSGNSFATINASGTIIIADLQNDVLSFQAGENIEISGDYINDSITINANLTAANSWANTKLANTTTTLDGSLTTTGTVTANGYVYITPVGGEEGGEIQLQSTGSNVSWSIDSYQNNFRVFARSGTTVSNLHFFHATGGSVQLGVNKTDPDYAVDVTGDVNISGSFRVNGTPLATGTIDLSPANSYTNVSTTAANNYAGAMANAANAYVEYSINSSNTFLNNLIGERANASNVFISSVYDTTNAAFQAANAEYTFTNAVYAAVNSAFDVINAAFASANNVAPQVAPAFNTANAAFDVANAAFTSANNVAPQVAPAFNTANAAFAAANAANSYANSTYVKLSSSSQTISGDLSITGNLNILGSTVTHNTDSFVVSDPLVLLASNNTADIVDIGFIAHYANATNDIVHTGFYRDHESKEWFIFKEYNVHALDYDGHISTSGNNFTVDVLNASLRTSNLNLGGANAIVWIKTAFDTVNAAFASANNVAPQIAPAFDTANAAFGAANSKVSSVSGTSGRITSSGGTTPTIDLATAGTGAASYSSGISAITVDAYGRVTSVTGSASYATTSQLSSYLPLAGGTMTGALTIGSTTDQQLTLNATDSSWQYIGFSHSGTRKSYFGIDGSGNPIWGTDSGSFSITGNFTTIGTSTRSPIFYDSDNTAFYVDPASTTNLNGLTVAGTITGSITGNAGTVTNGVYTTGNQTIGGTKTFSTSLRVPTVGTSWIGGFRGDSGITSTTVGTVGSYHGWYSARTPSGGFTIGTLSDTFYCNWATNANIDNNTNSISTPLYINSAGTAGAAGDFRAPIFYDSNNTGRYIDPNSTTLLEDCRASIFYDVYDTNYYIQGRSISYLNDLRPNIIYDRNDTGYYVNPNDVSYLVEPRMAWRSLIGNQNYDGTLFDGGFTLRPGIVIRGQYPHIDLVSTNINNGSHGPTLRFMAYDTADASSGNFKHWVIGCAGTNATRLSIGYASNNANPHEGIFGWGTSAMWFENDSNVYCNSSIRPTILYDRNDTYYYEDPNGSRRLAGRTYIHEWIEFVNFTALYSPNNGAHFHPNDLSYGSWRSRGSRNGWAGIEFDASQNISLMINTAGTVQGFHNNSVGWRLYIENGTGHFPGNVIAYWSDRRLKENLRPIGNEATQILSKLTAYRFNWNDKVKDFHAEIEPGKEEIGLIAQEVQAAIPDAVVVNRSANKANIDGTETESEYLTINWNKITPLLVQALNDTTRELAELKQLLKDKGIL